MSGKRFLSYLYLIIFVAIWLAVVMPKASNNYDYFDVAVQRGFFLFISSYVLFFCVIPWSIKKWEEKNRKEEDKKHLNSLLAKYGKYSTEDILFCNDIEYEDKINLLIELHGYTFDEAQELFNTSITEAKKARLRDSKRRISRKAAELYSNVPVDDERQPVSDEVKMFVWQRDGGKCIKCGSKENLEYDHIIPFSRGGSNTARNIQIMCEKCNREKRDNIA